MHDTIIRTLAPPAAENISPFLAKLGYLAQVKIASGYYCDRKMWVVDTEQGTQPHYHEQALSQLLTKTRAHEEEDDDSYLRLN
ncbi:hypothetical protein [Pseudomonas aeruginosa]|uniref:hypothetical protein n=1 Tax=Pseudomonas aeruginosa TaxID=287 RepID=UPI00287F7986|nr:hypothetical protein [Pseudomonas aeruginosa]